MARCELECCASARRAGRPVPHPRGKGAPAAGETAPPPAPRPPAIGDHLEAARREAAADAAYSTTWD